MSGCQDVRMSGCQNVRMSECQNVRMLGCQDVRMSGCQDVRMSIELMDFLTNGEGRTDMGRSRDAIASKKKSSSLKYSG